MRQRRSPAPPPEELPAWPGVLAAVSVGLVYLAVASGGTFRFAQSGFPHHVLIADAWLHGQLHVRNEILQERSAPYLQRYRARLEQQVRAQGRTLGEAEWSRIAPRVKTKPLHDWAVIDGRYYGYWGPVPAALLVPYVAAVGVDAASDRLFSCLIGAGTVFFAFLMLREVSRLGLLALSLPAAVALSLLLGLGTVHFYLSVMGQVWFLSQVVATFFLTLAVWTALRSDLGAGWTIASGSAFGAAVLSRSSVGTTLPFFVLAIVALRGGKQRGSPRLWAAWLAPFLIPLVLAGLISLAYNYGRFGDPFDTGVTAQTQSGANPRFKGDYEKYGAVNLHYLPRNFYYYFLNPMLRRHPTTGAITFDPDGNSMFLVTPALLFVFAAWRRQNAVTRAAWLGVATSLGMLLLFFGTGWFNFGNRYLLDLMPLLILLVAFGMRGKLTKLSAALIVLSLLANAWGTYRFALEQF